MRIEDERHITDADGMFVDVDVTPAGDLVAAVLDDVYNRVPVILTFPRGDEEGYEIELPRQAASPIVRWLPEGELLVIDRSTDDEDDAWIFDADGNMRVVFSAGAEDGIEDVVVTSTHIVVLYSDLAQAEGEAVSLEGLAFFDLDGEFVDPEAVLGSGFHAIGHCYAASVDDRGRLVVLPYPDFEATFLDLTAATREVFPTPEDTHGATATSVAGDRVFLLGRYSDPMTVAAMRLGEVLAAELGSLEVPLPEASLGFDDIDLEVLASPRGLPGGRFLIPLADGYQIVSFAE